MLKVSLASVKGSAGGSDNNYFIRHIQRWCPSMTGAEINTAIKQYSLIQIHTQFTNRLSGFESHVKQHKIFALKQGFRDILKAMNFPVL